MKSMSHTRARDSLDGRIELIIVDGAASVCSVLMTTVDDLKDTQFNISSNISIRSIYID